MAIESGDYTRPLHDHPTLVSGITPASICLMELKTNYALNNFRIAYEIEILIPRSNCSGHRIKLVSNEPFILKIPYLLVLV